VLLASRGLLAADRRRSISIRLSLEPRLCCSLVSGIHDCLAVVWPSQERRDATGCICAACGGPGCRPNPPPGFTCEHLYVYQGRCRAAEDFQLNGRIAADLKPRLMRFLDRHLGHAFGARRAIAFSVNRSPIGVLDIRRGPASSRRDSARKSPAGIDSRFLLRRIRSSRASWAENMASCTGSSAVAANVTIGGVRPQRAFTKSHSIAGRPTPMQLTWLDPELGSTVDDTASTFNGV